MLNTVTELRNQTWFQWIMKSEGGLNRKEPASVGGISYAGISQKAYDEWQAKGKCKIEDAPANVELLAGDVLGTDQEKWSPLEVPEHFCVRVDVILAFYLDYFFMARLEVVPESLRYIHADFFVNSRYNANRILQRMVGFTEKKDLDGILGPSSRKRIIEILGGCDDDDMIMEYHDLKLEHYESLKETNPDLYDGNIRGWRRRAQHVLGELASYFEDEEPTTSALLEEEDDDVFMDPEAETPVEGKDASVDTSERLKDLEITAALQQATDQQIQMEFYKRFVAKGGESDGSISERTD